MSHFTVLTALNIPSGIPAAMRRVPDESVAASIMEEVCMDRLFAKPGEPLPPIPEVTEQRRLEVLMERLVEPVLAPYCENAEDPAYLEFDDHTEDGRNEYENGVVDCVRMPEGRIIPWSYSAFNGKYELYDGQVYKRCSGQLHNRRRTRKAKRIKPLLNYPLKRLYPTFDVYMREYECCGLDEETGRYGYWSNPNGQWDWYQIGGRWPLRFLVKEDCQYAVSGSVSRLFDEPPKADAPEGYRWVAGARKCDIAWDVMRTYYQDDAKKHFAQYEEWFRSGQIPAEHTRRIELTDEGITSWGDLLYRKGETLDEFFARNGISDQDAYPYSTYACVDENTGWHSVGEMGWFGVSSNDKDADVWNKEVREFIGGQSDETVLLSVDCHR